MKLTRTIVSALLVILVIGGWTTCLLGIGSGAAGEDGLPTDDYKTCISKAEDYMNRSLYQKAVIEYSAAVSLKNKETDWSSLLEACQCRYEEDDSYLSQYLSYAKKAARAYKKNASFAVKAADLALADSDYSTAYMYLERAYDAGVKDEQLEKLYFQVKYSFTMDNTAYDKIRCISNNYFSVADGTSWGIISGNGSKKVTPQYDMCSSVGSNDIYVYSGEDGSGLADLTGVIQGKLDFDPVDAGVYAEGLVPVSNGASWSYYDVLGDKIFGDYEMAGAFQNGKAAVKTDDGWSIIDSSGVKLSETFYEEIRLNGDGSYLKENVMLAKTDDVWHLYDENEKQIGDFSCNDVDVINGNEAFAFQREGKWGFCDLEGNEIIAPVYDNAHSFSCGLAGVCVDGKWGFINKNQIVVIECLYLDVDYFTNKNSCMVETMADSWQMIHLRITD